MLEYFYGKKFGSKVAWANGKEEWQGSGGSEYRNRLCRVKTHMEATATSLRKGDSHLKHNSLTSTNQWLTPTRALSPSHTRPWPPCVVVTLHNLFLHSDSPLPCHPSFLLAQAIFEPNLFPYKYSNIFKPIVLHTYPPMKMEQTVFRSVSI